jgi:serine/threonine protein kinase
VVSIVIFLLLAGAGAVYYFCYFRHANQPTGDMTKSLLNHDSQLSMEMGAMDAVAVRKQATVEYSTLKKDLKEKMISAEKEIQVADTSKNYEVLGGLKKHFDELQELYDKVKELKPKSSSNAAEQQQLLQQLQNIRQAVPDAPRESLHSDKLDRLRTTPFDKNIDVPFAAMLGKSLSIGAAESDDAARKVLYAVRYLTVICSKEFEGRWELLEVIGVGGFGVVVRTNDKKLRQQVALKVVLPSDGTGVFGSDEQKRLNREALAMERVNHSSVATFHEAHFVEKKRLYFMVIELARGSSLAEVSQATGPLPTHKLLQICISLLSALDALHEKNIVHLDIKPGNIMYDESGADVSIKLIDFGLARAPSQSGTGAVDDVTAMHGTTMRTQSASVAGTVMYMPPEQIEGKPLGFHADIFSAGVTLYKLACGHFPHADMCHSQAAALRVLDSWVATPPPLANQWVGSVPRELSLVLATAISPLQEDRFPTAVAMLAALKALQEMHVVISSPGVSLQGENVMEFVQQSCAGRRDIAFGYDWEGSSSADDRDKQDINWSDGNSVKQSYWFKGYRESVKGQVKLLCQTHKCRIVLICIEGGPISQLEANEIRNTLVREVERDLASRKMKLDITVKQLTFDAFKQEMQLGHVDGKQGSSRQSHGSAPR